MITYLFILSVVAAFVAGHIMGSSGPRYQNKGYNVMLLNKSRNMIEMDVIPK